MPTSFGKADEIAANQPSELTLSAWDTSATCQNGGAAGFLNKKIAATAKWRVRWKSATSVMPQTNAAQFSPETLKSDYSLPLPQVQARRISGWRENEVRTMYSPQRSPTTQSSAVQFNTGQVGIINVGLMGNAYGGYHPTQFFTQSPAPRQEDYYQPGYPGGPPPPNMPGSSDYCPEQFEHGPCPQNSAGLTPRQEPALAWTGVAPAPAQQWPTAPPFMWYTGVPSQTHGGLSTCTPR